MSIRRRLERLEVFGGTCPECVGPWKRGDPLEYVVNWGDGETSDPLPLCSECGRERGVILRVEYEGA